MIARFASTCASWTRYSPEAYLSDSAPDNAAGTFSASAAIAASSTRCDADLHRLLRLGRAHRASGPHHLRRRGGAAGEDVGGPKPTSAHAGHRRLAALHDLVGREVLNVRGDLPRVPEWIGNNAEAVAPELVFDRHFHRRARVERVLDD